MVKRRGDLRPKGWANWRALEGGEGAKSGEEHLLYSDATIHGTEEELGPLGLYNLASGRPEKGVNARAVLALRTCSFCVSAFVLAARRGSFDRESIGRPRFEAEVDRPYLPAGHWTPIIDRGDAKVSLGSALPLLRTYPRLDAPDATLYDLRSGALHAGEVFPTLLCIAPPTHRRPDRPYDVERADIAQELGIKDAAVPMYLHLFEYLVHGAIVKWWRKLTSRPRTGLRARAKPST